MPILVVSSANLRTLKSILMAEFEVRSSHGSELIAALCGYKSYAALKADLDTFQFAPSAWIDFERFARRHKELGYDSFTGEHLRHSFNRIPFPDQPWLFHSTNENWKRNHWFSHCDHANIPFITIHKKVKYCYLEWDCISIDREFESPSRQSDADDVGRMLLRLFQLICGQENAKPFFEGSSFYGNVTRLSDTAARELANNFFMQLTPWRLDAKQTDHSHSIVQVHHKLLELLDKIFILVWVAESRSVKFLTL